MIDMLLLLLLGLIAAFFFFMFIDATLGALGLNGFDGLCIGNREARALASAAVGFETLFKTDLIFELFSLFF